MLWFKALHLIAAFAWMAGLFYLPRLLVYHAQEEVGSKGSELFKVMERRLLRAIMAPAAVATWLFGALTAWAGGYFEVFPGWLAVKLAGLAGLTLVHLWLARVVAEMAALPLVIASGLASGFPEVVFRFAEAALWLIFL